MGGNGVVVVHIGHGRAVEEITVVAAIDGIGRGVTTFPNTCQYIFIYRIAVHLPSELHTVLHCCGSIALCSSEAGNGSRLVEIEFRSANGDRLELQGVEYMQVSGRLVDAH